MDRVSLRIGMLCLTMLALVGMGGCLYLAMHSQHDPAGLCVVAGSAIGALATLIVPPHRVDEQ